MPKVHQMKDSRFLKKEDCGPGVLATIADCYQENIGLDDGPEQLAWVLSFKEPNLKPMVLKSVNMQLIHGITGSDDTDHWKGKVIVLYHDVGVMMKGKVVGGIRARAPKAGYQAAGQRGATSLPPAAEAAQEELGEEVPY